MENEVKVETKKKGNGLFTLFACVMTGIIVFLGTNLGQKIADNNDNGGSTKKSNVTSNVESNITSNVTTSITSTLIYDGIQVVDSTKGIDVKKENNSCSILYNSKAILNSKDICGLKNVYLIGDVIMTEWAGTDGTGFIRFNDFNGNDLLKVSGDSSNKTSIVYQNSDKVTVSGDTITFTTSLYNFSKTTCSTYKDYGVELTDNAQVTYQLKYLGNKKFSNLTVVSKKTVQEFCK